VGDMDEMLRKAQAGGSVIGIEWAKSEREMKEMMMLSQHVRKKKLEVTGEKVKMMVFSKRKRKSDESEWKLEGMKIKQVNEFQYLGYTFSGKSH
jgi:hypothetical protein